MQRVMVSRVIFVELEFRLKTLNGNDKNRHKSHEADSNVQLPQWWRLDWCPLLYACCVRKATVSYLDCQVYD